MFCQNCGVEIADDSRICPQCHRPPLRSARYAPPSNLGDDAGMRMLLPVGRSVLAIAAGYFGLISVLIFPAPIALLLGILAVVDIKRHPEKHGMGRAIFAIVMGSFFSLFLAIMAVGAIGAALSGRR